MSKIKYEIFGNIGEISGYEQGSGDVKFFFSGTDATYFAISDHKYDAKSGSVSIPRENIRDGLHIPRLHTKKGQIILPLIEFEGAKISFPESEGVSRTLSLKLAKMNLHITELEARLAELDEYVHGSTCL